jgi:hypothetical protein
MRYPTMLKQMFLRAGCALSIVLGAAAMPAAAQSPAIAPELGAGRGILAGRDVQPANDATGETAERSKEHSLITLSFLPETDAHDIPAARFATLAGGTIDVNDTELDRLNNRAAERRYVRDSVPAGMTIAEGILVDASNASIMRPLTRAGTLELVLIGHLEELDVPQAHPDSVMLWIDVDRDGVRSTHAIRARDLMRRSPAESFDRYQQAVVRLDATDAGIDRDVAAPVVGAHVALVSMPAVRVRFAGTATVALNSMELRVASGHTEQ